MKNKFYLLLIALIFVAGCNQNNTDDDNVTEEEIDNETDEDVETYILVELAGAGAYIINQEGEEIYNFDLNYQLANDANLLEDGSLVASVKTENPAITIGGYGGRFIKQNADKTIEWEIEYASENYISHHDVEYLPNGNILFLVWNKVENSVAQNIGFSGTTDIFPDAVIEMNPLTEEIVWQWDMMDHLIQDYDDSKENFGEVSSNPDKIDINFNKDRTDGDITHANGLVLDPATDLLYITVNYYNEVWVIDHSTTMEEATTNSGGNYGIGGDLVYRFGNPEAYKNFERNVIFNRVHAPNLLDNGNFLLYANQETNEQSEALELKLPDTLSLAEDTYEDPEIVWSFTDEALFSNIMSNAERMKNGNTLINEGRVGTIWEVSESGDVLWQYETDPPEQWIWKAYVLYSDDPGVKALNID